jgi:hypothetical protein
MPIQLGYAKDPSAAAELAYYGGVATGRAKRAAEERQYAFRQQEAERRRQHSFETMERNAQLQQQAAEEAQQRQMEMQLQSWSYKDQTEKSQIKERRGQYLQKRQMIQDKFDSQEIGEDAYNYAMEELHKRYGGGDVDVTAPWFPEATRQDEEPTMKMPDGTEIPMAMDKDGNPDRYTTRMEWEKLKREQRENEIEHRLEIEDKILEYRKSLESQTVKMKEGLGEKRVYSDPQIDERVAKLRERLEGYLLSGDAEEGPAPGEGDEVAQEMPPAEEVEAVTREISAQPPEERREALKEYVGSLDLPYELAVQLAKEIIARME